MKATDFLKKQHREVEKLFARAKQAEGDELEQLFLEIADDLAIHAQIEEKFFYPAIREARTEDILQESLQEHLQVKRILAQMLDMEVDDAKFMTKLAELEKCVSHHVEEEEEDLFPKVEQDFEDEALLAMGEEMSVYQEALEGTDAFEDIPKEAKETPSLDLQ